MKYRKYDFNKQGDLLSIEYVDKLPPKARKFYGVWTSDLIEDGIEIGWSKLCLAKSKITFGTGLMEYKKE